MSRAIAMRIVAALMISSAAAPSLLYPGSASASHESSEGKAPLDPAYVAECGTCHVAYPPKLLAADAWKKLMTRLDRHFGMNAELDAKQAAAIAAYLQRNAGSRPSATATAEPRITQSPWFEREHRKVAASVWSIPAVKSRANCGACHTRAEVGSYREREIRVPK